MSEETDVAVECHLLRGDAVPTPRARTAADQSHIDEAHNH